MSNTLAIAAVTGVLESRLTALINASGMSGFGVFADHPTGTTEAGVYIKLYRIVPNTALRNSDLPTRRSDGSVVTRPRLAINLHYLLTFVGAKSTYDAERLAGLVMTDLHATPVLTPASIQDYLEGLPAGHVLEDTDLGDQLDRVRLTPLALDDEQAAKVWGLFNQSFYALSVAYEASVVLLDAEVRPRAALPVASAGLYVFPTGIPRITRVRTEALDQPVVTLGQDLVVEGTNLRGPSTWLRLGGELFEVAEDQIGVDRITFPLTAALGLRAGVTSVEVVHRLDVDADPAVSDYRTAATSNAAPFGLLATVTPGTVSPTTGGHDVRLSCVPAPGEDQEVELLMDRVGGGAHASSTSWRVVGADVVFTVAGLSAGRWLVRLRVDGATSGLTSTGAGPYSGPAVDVP